MNGEKPGKELVNCPRCKGRGKIFVPPVLPSCEPGTEETCKGCGGSGLLPELRKPNEK